MTLVYNETMPQTNSERQRAFQQRKAARAVRMEAALTAIVAALADTGTPKGKAVKALAEDGLR